MAVKLIYSDSISTPNLCGDRNVIKTANKLVEHIVSCRTKENPANMSVFYWSSSLFILKILQAVRKGIIRTDDIEIHDEDGKIVDVCTKGEFIQPWTSDLFELSFKMRFDC